MLQGDCYNLPFRITRHGRIMTNEDVSEVEICIGRLNKKYSNNAVFFSEGLWYFSRFAFWAISRSSTWVSDMTASTTGGN